MNELPELVTIPMCKKKLCFSENSALSKAYVSGLSDSDSIGAIFI